MSRSRVESIGKASEDVGFARPVLEAQHPSKTDPTMSSPNLERLAREGELKREFIAPAETRHLVDRAASLLSDSKRPSLSLESRASLMCEAAFAIAAAALARHGYRTLKRDVAFQCLEHAAGSPPAGLAVLALLLERYRKAQRHGSTQAGDAALLEDAGRVVEVLIERVSR